MSWESFRRKMIRNLRRGGERKVRQRKREKSQLNLIISFTQNEVLTTQVERGYFVKGRRGEEKKKRSKKGQQFHIDLKMPWEGEKRVTNV